MPTATPNMLEGKTVKELRLLAREDAQALLADYWVDMTIPVDPLEISRAMGISVFEAQLGDDTYGMIIGSEGGADIYVDEDSAPVRKRFTIAHELGHAISHRDELAQPGIGFVDKRSDSGRGSASEVYANEFAAELLMPFHQFSEAIRNGMTDFDLAAMFQVSLQSCAYRRRILGL